MHGARSDLPTKSADQNACRCIHCVCADSVGTLAFARMFGSRRGSGCFNRGRDWMSMPRIGSDVRRVSERVASLGFAGGIRSLRLTPVRVTPRAELTARHSRGLLLCVCADSVGTLAFARMFGFGRGSGCFNRGRARRSLPRIGAWPRRRRRASLGRVSQAESAPCASPRSSRLVLAHKARQTLSFPAWSWWVGSLPSPQSPLIVSFSAPPAIPDQPSGCARRRNRVPGSIFARADELRPRPSGWPREEIEPGTVFRPLDESRSTIP